jgi:putative flippase GtrA
MSARRLDHRLRSRLAGTGLGVESIQRDGGGAVVDPGPAVAGGDADRLRHHSPRTMPSPQPAPIHRSTTPQFIRYAGAGAVGTAVQYALLVVLVHAADVAAVAASTVGAIAGALVNYGINHQFTFASDRAHGHALPRFAVVAVAGIALNAIVLAAMLALVTPHYLVAQVVATGAVLVAGFIANRTWTF